MSSTAASTLIGLVIVAGALLLAAAGWLIWRIEQQGEENAARVSRLVVDVHAVLRILKFAAECMTQHVQQQQQRGTRREGAEASFNAHQLGQIVGALEPLLQRLKPPAATPGQPDDSAAELRRVLALKGRLDGELETLREQHRLQLKSLAEQRRDHQLALSALSNSSALREVNEQLIGELRDARQRNQELAARLDPVTTELKILREQMALLLAAPSMDGSQIEQLLAEAADSASAVHQERIDKLEAELRRLNDENLQVKDELSRTLREKSFIEDQFLTLAEAEDATQAEESAQAAETVTA